MDDIPEDDGEDDAAVDLLTKKYSILQKYVCIKQSFLEQSNFIKLKMKMSQWSVKLHLNRICLRQM